MSEKQFDIFDEPFRKAAELVEPEFNEASWVKMEAKLDKNLQRKPARWFVWFTDFIMIALLIALALELQTNKSSVTTTAQSNILRVKTATGKPEAGNSSEIVTEKQVPVDGAKPANNLDYQTLAVNKVVAATSETSKGNLVPAVNKQTNAALTNNADATNKQQAGGNKNVQVKHDPAAVGSGNKTKGVKEKNTDVERAIETPAFPNTAAKDMAGVDDVTRKMLVSAENESFDGIVIDDDYQLLEATIKSHSAEVAENVAALEGTTSKTAGLDKTVDSVAALKPRVVAFKGLYVHAGISPEWSFIGGGDVGPVTTAYAGGIGFASGKRWSVQAGISASKKLYGAGPGGYKPKPGSYFYNLKINYVDASCNILEIPLTFNYSLLSRRQHRLIASAGLSSLVMQKEIYDYDYQRRNGTQAHYKHTYETGKFHPFSVATLSAGYQYSLSQRLALQAMPYVKMPLYGIGEGSVKITSAGFVLGLQYGFDAFKPKTIRSKKTGTAGKN